MKKIVLLVIATLSLSFAACEKITTCKCMITVDYPDDTPRKVTELTGGIKEGKCEDHSKVILIPNEDTVNVQTVTCSAL